MASKNSTLGGKNQLRKIIYYPAEGEAIDIASLTYTNNVLTSVTDRAGRNIAITVADDTRLTRITDYDGYYSAYTYCSFPYRITSAYDAQTHYGVELHYNCESGGNGLDTVNSCSSFTAETEAM